MSSRISSKIVGFFSVSSSSSSSSSFFLNFFFNLSKRLSLGTLSLESFLNSGTASSSVISLSARAASEAVSAEISSTSERISSLESAAVSGFFPGFLLRFLKPPLLRRSAIIPVPRYSITTSMAPVTRAMRIFAILKGE